MYGLLSTLKFKLNLVEIFALHEGALGSVGVDLYAICFVLLAGFVDVPFLCLFGLELLLDSCLIGALVVELLVEEDTGLTFQICFELLCDVEMEARLPLCLNTKGVQ